MIVICTGCQAKFRVADEKVGPRGAKVRCTRCQNLFLVSRDPAPPAPALELDLTPGVPRPVPSRDPFAPSGVAGDPFAPAGAKQPMVQFPPAELGASGLLAGGAAPAQDPFAAADAFGAGGPSPGVSQSLPVTDLAQLLGGAAAASPAAAEPGLAPPPPAPEPPPSAFDAFGGDLTLEERKAAGPAPAAFADPADVFPADPGPLRPSSSAPLSFSAAFPPGVFDDSALPPPMPGEESLSLATDPTPGPPGGGLAVAPLAAVADDPPPPPPRARTNVPAPEPVAAHPALAPGSKLRSAAVNALALVALVVMALGARAVMRGDARLGPGALRPSRLVQALFGPRAPAAPFEVAEVRTGVYPQASGTTVVFVRGVVICRSAAPDGGVKVAAELVRDGQVLARGDVRAGAVPTPEDVWKAADRAGLDALAADLARRAPKKVAAGDRLEFVVALADAPGDLAGTTVRLQAGAATR